MNLDFPPDLQSNLEDLQDYYQRLVDYANAQLSHVKALLNTPPIPESPKEVAVVKRQSKPAIFSNSAPVSISPVEKKSPRTEKARGRAKTKPATTRRSRIKPSDLLALRPEYQGQTLLGAIAQVLQKNEGKKLNADAVVKELHGELSEDLFRTAKDRVTKNLSKGKLEKKWESVPGQTGYYTSSNS